MDWIINLFDINNVLFVVDGKEISLLELVTVVFGLAAVYLASKGKVVNYPVNYIYTVFLFFMLSQKHLYANMMLQPVCLAINIYGLYRWTHPRKGEAQNSHKGLKVTYLTNRQRLLYIIGVGIFTLAWGWVLINIDSWFYDAVHNVENSPLSGSIVLRLNSWTGGVIAKAQSPFLDSFVAAMLILSQWLAAIKKWDCWISWIIVNVTNIILYIISGLVFMPMLSAAYLIFNAIGILHWRKESREQQQNA